MPTRFLMFTLAVILAFGGFITAPRSAEAHQPFCEFTDITFDTAWQVTDPSVSVAYYGNLYPAADVDYFTFDAEADQEVYLQMTIPDIEGQEDFVPMMAVFGSGLDQNAVQDIPARVQMPADAGVFVVPAVDESERFWEPFGRRYYWQWQDADFVAPQAGSYTVAVWHPEERLGRYTFVIGKREVLGGSLDCFTSFDDYWTPLVAGQNPYRDGGEDHDHAAHNHDDLLDVSAEGPIPTVDVQLFPLGDGDYNVRVQVLNFEFAPQSVNGEHMPGQGHAHLYIDDVKITRLYGEWYYLESAPEDAEMVWVGLYANDHRALGVNGEPITASVMLSDAAMDMAGTAHDSDTHTHE
jgi:hypothetical protein